MVGGADFSETLADDGIWRTRRLASDEILHRPLLCIFALLKDWFVYFLSKDSFVYFH